MKETYAEIRETHEPWLRTIVDGEYLPDPVVGPEPSVWTYAQLRTLSFDEVATMWPGALEHYDTQCSDLHDRARFVCDPFSAGRLTLRLSIRDAKVMRSSNKDDLGVDTTWVPEMQLWVRYSKDVRRDKRTLNDMFADMQVPTFRVNLDTGWVTEQRDYGKGGRKVVDIVQRGLWTFCTGDVDL